jgi:hypothetical protein
VETAGDSIVGGAAAGVKFREDRGADDEVDEVAVTGDRGRGGSGRAWGNLEAEEFVFEGRSDKLAARSSNYLHCVCSLVRFDISHIGETSTR